jgi:hypothetical protein
LDLCHGPDRPCADSIFSRTRTHEEGHHPSSHRCNSPPAVTAVLAESGVPTLRFVSFGKAPWWHGQPISLPVWVRLMRPRLGRVQLLGPGPIMRAERIPRQTCGPGAREPHQVRSTGTRVWCGVIWLPVCVRVCLNLLHPTSHVRSATQARTSMHTRSGMEQDPNPNHISKPRQAHVRTSTSMNLARCTATRQPRLHLWPPVSLPILSPFLQPSPQPTQKRPLRFKVEV